MDDNFKSSNQLKNYYQNFEHQTSNSNWSSSNNSSLVNGSYYGLSSTIEDGSNFQYQSVAHHHNVKNEYSIDTVVYSRSDFNNDSYTIYESDSNKQSISNHHQAYGQSSITNCLNESDKTKTIKETELKSGTITTNKNGNSPNQHQQQNKSVTLRPHSTPATLMWLESNYELAEGVCIPRSVLYLHYIDFCQLNRVQPVNAASFGKIIRQQFPQLTTRRLGTRGQSRYHYYGIAIKENSSYYQVSYSKKSVQMQCSSENGRKYNSNSHKHNHYHYNHHNGSKKMARSSNYEQINNSCSSTTLTMSQYFPVHKPMSSPQESVRASVQPQQQSNRETSLHQIVNNKMYHQLNPIGDGVIKEKMRSVMDHNHHQLLVSGKSSIENERDENENSTVLKPLVVNQKNASNQNTVGSNNYSNSLIPVLPQFPTSEELQICQNYRNNLIPTFLLMYRAHCQRILDAIVRANFEEVHTLVYHFWQQIPPHLIPVMNSNLFINLLAICDIRLYRTIIKIVSMTFVQPLSEVAYNQLENFANAYDSVLQAALPRENVQLIQIKLELARHFIALVKCLLRHCRIFYSLQNQLFNCHGLLKQLYSDWTRIDVNHLCDRIIEIYHKTGTINYLGGSAVGDSSSHSTNLCEKLHKLIYKYLSEFKMLLVNMIDCTQLLDWFENTWNGSMRIYFQHRQQTTVNEEDPKDSTFFDTDFSRHFLIIWTFVKLQTIQEFIKIKASSHDLFITFSSLFDDFCIYKIKDIYFDHCIKWFYANAAMNSKPTWPQNHCYDPVEVIRHTTSLASNLASLNDQSYETFSDGATSSTGSSFYNGSGSGNSHSNHHHHHHHHQNDQNGGIYSEDGGYCGTSNNTSDQQQRNNHYYSQQYQTRQDSLICFSMNFHANSIQVMAAPSSSSLSSTGVNSVGNGDGTYPQDEPTSSSGAYHHYQYHHHRHHQTSKSSPETCNSSNSNGSGNKSIRCYFSSENCQNIYNNNR